MFQCSRNLLVKCCYKIKQLTSPTTAFIKVVIKWVHHAEKSNFPISIVQPCYDTDLREISTY